MSSHRSQRAASSLLTGLMLYQQLQRSGLLERGRKLPVATLSLSLAAFALHFFGPEVQRLFPFLPLDPSSGAVVPRLLVQRPGSTWPRLLLAALHHATDTHLYYNLVSLIWKGSRLEERWGSARFAAACVALTVAAHTIMVALSFALHQWPPTAAWSDYRSPAVGMSALLFALKVLVNAQPAEAHRYTSVGGFSVPSRWAAWAELGLVQLLVPQASFLGHLGGILAGMAYLVVVEPFGPRGHGNAAAWAPMLLLLAPVRWLWRALQGGGGGGGAAGGAAGGGDGGGARRRFNHDPNGYVIGPSPPAASAPSAAAAAAAAARLGLHQRAFPAAPGARSSSPQRGHRSSLVRADSDGDVEIVPPRPSAPPLPLALGGLSASPPAAAARPSAQRHAGGHSFEREADQLVAMGFQHRHANLAALRATGGNIDAAISRLV